ncbi:MAG: type IV pilus secretin PilQ family protein, partial [Pseudomonadota bacterium]
DTVLTIEPTGDYDYLAYQTDQIVTLEVKPFTSGELEASLDRAFLYRGEKLSLNFQDIEIRSVLQVIAEFTDLNLVASDTVAGRITLRLKNVPWDQALELIMKTKGLDQRKVGNVLMVAPAQELAAREKLELESQAQISELTPLRTEFIEVRYAKASEIFALFEGTGEGNSGVISPRGSVIVDERTNSIILTETADKIAQFRDVLKRLDVPVRQVLIEARIVNANTIVSEQLGVRWGGGGFGIYDDGNISTQYGSSVNNLSTIRNGIATNSLTVGEDSLFVDFGGPGPRFATGIVGDKFLLDLELSALETESLVETVARPRIITSDKQQATISQGTQIPYETETSAGGTATEFKNATLLLDVTPQITPDDRVIMDLSITQDTPGAETPDGLAIDTKQLQTQVLVDNGQTIVLGGIFDSENSKGTSKIPVLGDLPYVKRLFSGTTDRNRKTELLIFITPRLVSDSLTGR